MPMAHALTKEEATRVGGDLTRVGQDLTRMAQQWTELRDTATQIVQAAPDMPREFLDAVGRIAAAGGAQEASQSLMVAAASVLAMVLLAWAVRRFTARWRERCITSTIRVRGALGLLALDTLQWSLFAAGAYLAVQLFFSLEVHHHMLVVALMSGLVRWRLFMLFLHAALRPALPQFRLISMSDQAARELKWFFAGATFIGIMGIAVMPVLLRAGLPVPAGQWMVLIQGVLVALGCALGLSRYLASHSSPERAYQVWRWVGTIGIPLIWVSWSFAVVTLEFAAFHSLVYSLRIAMIAYAAYALLELSAKSHWWVRLLQHAAAAGAVLGIVIVLTELWLVERLNVIPMATWTPIRESLTTASITMFIGFVAWNYLHLWTEQRLRAASHGSPGIDDDIAAQPASRLTTMLPLIRVLVGATIVLLVAFLALSQLGADFTTLLAGAGVFGLALSFGSQALVRDIVSGIFFMSDDAFRVGEYIDTGKLKGTVERVTMRSVQLRHQNGQIHTIPFGQLASVTNYSRNWRTIKFNLRVAAETDIDKARKAAKRVGQELQQDAEFGPEFLLPLKMQGVAEIVDNAVVLRFKFTVRPINPTMVYRESLKRLRAAFAEDGIAFAAGLVTVRSASNPATADEAAAAAAAMATVAALAPAGT